MQKKLTITLDAQVYDGLHRVIGRRRISRFIESLVRPHVAQSDLDAAYRQMAADEAHETEALEWAEATIGDVAHEQAPTHRTDRPTRSRGSRPYRDRHSSATWFSVGT